MDKVKKCPKCQKEVDAKATKCPHCQSDLRSWVRQHPIGLLVLILLFVPAVMSAILSDSSAPVSQEQSVSSMKKSAIESFSRSYIKDILKAPSTAKFNYFPSTTADPKDPNSYEIKSSVTSENSFGAKLDSTWSIKAHYIGADTEDAINDGSNWIIDEVYFDGKKVK